MGISSLKDANAKFNIALNFTATGVITGSGAADSIGTAAVPFNVRAENQLRLAVENVGAGNAVQVQGRIAKQTAYTTLATITGPSAGTTVDISLVDEIYFNCSTYSASGGTPRLVGAGFFKQAASGGGGGGTWGSITGTLSDQTDLQSALDGKQDDLTGSFNSVAGFDGSGLPWSIPGWQVNTAGGPAISIDVAPNNGSGGNQIGNLYGSLRPLVNSPNESWNVSNLSLFIDPDSDGFTIGTAGDLGYLNNWNIQHVGTSDTGRIAFTNQYFGIGNGTDAISVKGLAYQFGFGSVAANVTIEDYFQGYGFQPSLNASTTMLGYTTAFYDSANYACATPSYTSYNASPTIASIANNGNYTAYNVNPTITTLTGNAGFNGVAVAGQIGTINSGGFNGVNVSPTVTLNKGYAYGVYANVSNITNYAGLQSSVVVQDITYEFIAAGDNDAYTIEYVDDTTAGNESITILGQAITVHIESGVSTATQVAAAAALNLGFIGAVSVTITGTGSNAQVAAAAVNFAGGENPGVAKAAQFVGDVEIQGALSFTGALSVGAINAFTTNAIVSGTGTPVSFHSLITAPTVAANATVTLADTLGVNTAMLLTVGANATVTTGFLGVQALGLPAVVSLGAGATVDHVGGAVFALSLDAAAGGGTIAEVDLCSALVIPNGVTTVNDLRGYFFDMPFGDVGTDSWGVYAKPASSHNYFAGDIVVGSSDLPTNSSVGIELNSTTKAVLLPRMTSAQEAALTAVDGMIIYNTSTSKFRGYEGGAWVDLV